MVGCVQGLLGSLKSSGGGGGASYFKCTTFQISIACCTNTTQCGTLGAGASCTTPTTPDPFDPNAC